MPPIYATVQNADRGSSCVCEACAGKKAFDKSSLVFRLELDELSRKRWLHAETRPSIVAVLGS